MEVVWQAGGVVVLAHPGAWFYNGAGFDELDQMVEMGLQGLECYSFHHDEALTARFVEYCRSRDLLITGAILHDIGKLDEYGYDEGFIDFTDEGRLWGHISIGAQRIRTVIEEMEKEESFPAEMKKQLIHLILSHQGKLEHGSPVLPATMEAMILYYADEMDSKANALKHIIERDSEPGRRWSQYINLLDRFIYLKPPPENDPSPSESLFE